MTEMMAFVTDNDASTNSNMTPCKLSLKSTAGSVQMFLLEVDRNFLQYTYQRTEFSPGISSCIVFTI